MNTNATPADQDPKETHSDVDPLLGKYFHTLLNGRVNHQGQIVNKVDANHYLVDLFSFLTSEYSCQRVFAASDMKDWLIYKTQAEMVYSFDQGVASRLRP